MKLRVQQLRLGRVTPREDLDRFGLTCDLIEWNWPSRKPRT